MDENKKTAAQALAHRITTRLLTENLLAKERAERFSASLASGKLKAGDWRVALEAVNQPEAKPRTE